MLKQKLDRFATSLEWWQYLGLVIVVSFVSAGLALLIGGE